MIFTEIKKKNAGYLRFPPDRVRIPKEMVPKCGTISISAQHQVLLQSTKGMLDLRVLLSKLFSQKNLTRKLQQLPGLFLSMMVSTPEKSPREGEIGNKEGFCGSIPTARHLKPYKKVRPDGANIS